jgi:hypothetical protein
MSILAIARNFNGDPNIVTIVTDDDLTALTTTGYWALPETVDSVAALQNGAWEWADTDLVLIHYDTTLIGFFVYDAVNECFDALAPSGGLADTLQSANIFVGNSSNIATGVAVTGDITMSDTGVVGIAAGAIVNADINAAAAIAFSKLAALPSAQILVGSAGNVATAVAMSGDVTITNAGVTAIGAGKVLLAMLGAGIAPAGVIKYMGQLTSVGGAAAEAFTVTGAVGATDRAFVQVVDNGTNNVTVLQAVVTNNTLTVTFSADPGADAVINYQLIRAAA